MFTALLEKILGAGINKHLEKQFEAFKTFNDLFVHFFKYPFRIYYWE